MNSKEISKFIKGKENKELVEIYRGNIDEISMLGNVVSFSQLLFGFRNLVDFSFDGYKIVRCRDITEIITKDKNSSLNFMDMICKKELSFEPCMFSDRLKSWNCLFEYLINNKLPVTVECSFEDAIDYYVGWVLSINTNIVEMQCFDGSGILFKDKVKVNLDFVTCVTLGDRYTTFMAKYVDVK